MTKKKYYSIYEAKTSLSKLIQKALRGEKVIISKRNRPIVEITALAPETQTPLLGRFEKQIEIAKDFDAPLEEFKEYQK